MNDIEEKFYKTFGIEPFIYCSKPRLDCNARSVGTCTKDCEYYSGILYPEITDRILLELICILNSIDEPPYAHTVNELKEDTLIGAINTLSRCETKEWLDNFKNKVQSLFREGEE